MDWIQTLTIAGPIVAPIGAGIFALYKMLKSEFAEFKADIAKIDAQHRANHIL